MLTEYRYHAFISYSHGDRDLVQRIVDQLSGPPDSFRVFVDQSDIRENVNWRHALSEAINGAQVTAVIYTERAAGSDWVKAEAAKAGDRALYLIPDRVGTPGPPGDRQPIEVVDPQTASSWAEPIRTYLRKNAEVTPRWRDRYVLAQVADDQAGVLDHIEDLDVVDLAELIDDPRDIILVVTDQVSDHLDARPADVGLLVARRDGSPRQVYLLHERSSGRILPIGLRVRMAAVAAKSDKEAVEAALIQLLYGETVDTSGSAPGVDVAIAAPGSIYSRIGPTSVARGPRRSRAGGVIPYRLVDGSLMSKLSADDNASVMIDQHLVTLEQWCAFLNGLDRLGLVKVESLDGLSLAVHRASGRWLGADAHSYYEKRRRGGASVWERHGPAYQREVGWHPMVAGDLRRPATMMTWWGASAYAAWISGEPVSDEQHPFHGHHLPTVGNLRAAAGGQTHMPSAIESDSEAALTELDWIRLFGGGRSPGTTGPAMADRFPKGEGNQCFYSVVGNVAEWCAADWHTGELADRLGFVPVFGGSYRSPREHCEPGRGAALLNPWSFAPDRGFRCRPALAMKEAGE